LYENINYSKIIYCTIYGISISSIINYFIKDNKYKFYYKILYVKFFTPDNKFLYFVININNSVYS